MTVAFLCFSRQGEETARRLALDPGDRVLRVSRGGLAACVADLWREAGALVFVSSLGVAVRAVAPHLADKEADPAVLAVTEDGRVVLPVTGAHLGGGRDLADRLGARLGVPPLLTTSSDRAGLTAPDLLASRRGWALVGRGNLPTVNRMLLENGRLLFWTDIPRPLRMPGEYGETPRPEDAQLLVSFRRQPLGEKQVQLVPPCVVAGIGCRKGTTEETLARRVRQSLAKEGILAAALREIRTVEEKAGEEGMRSLARTLGLPLRVVDRDVLLSLPGPFSPSAAERRLGLPGVAEPCAASAGPLLGARSASDGVTLAFALTSPVPGKLYIVGTGPGHGEFMTLQGRRALEESDVVVGYRLYCDLLPPSWLEGKTVESYSMGEEERRTERAISLAEEGQVVSLLSGGDPILFGLAALALRKAAGRVPASVIPGLTAAQAAGAILGAPYTNGLVLLSLSDYLQPWESVRKALEGAAASGLTVALYNPVKRDLAAKLGSVREIFASRGCSRTWLLRDAGRTGGSVRRISLEDLTPDTVDMRTLIVLPGDAVEDLDGLLLDRRGYRTEGGARGS